MKLNKRKQRKTTTTKNHQNNTPQKKRKQNTEENPTNTIKKKNQQTKQQIKPVYSEGIIFSWNTFLSFTFLVLDSNFKQGQILWNYGLSVHSHLLKHKPKNKLISSICYTCIQIKARYKASQTVNIIFIWSKIAHVLDFTLLAYWIPW